MNMKQLGRKIRYTLNLIVNKIQQRNGGMKITNKNNPFLICYEAYASGGIDLQVVYKRFSHPDDPEDMHTILLFWTYSKVENDNIEIDHSRRIVVPTYCDTEAIAKDALKEYEKAIPLALKAYQKMQSGASPEEFTQTIKRFADRWQKLQNKE